MQPASTTNVRSRRNALEDIEMAEYPTSQREGRAAAPQGCPTRGRTRSCGSSRGRNLAIHELFGLGNQEERNRYPGVDRFFRHVEKECFPRLAEFDKAMWPLMKEVYTTGHSQQWKWCAHVIQTCRRLQNSNPTVEELATEFLSAHGQENVIFGELGENVQFAIVKALLHTLCWLSVTIMPVVEKQDLVDVRTPNGPAKALSLTALYNGMKVSRPVTLNSTLGQIFHQINQAAVPTPMEEGGMDGQRFTRATGDVVHEPCVTYASLRKYAGVRLKWVSTLSEHLSLDRDTGVLSVFQYPSVCAVRIQNRNKCKVISNITNWLLPSRDYGWPNGVGNEERVCQQVILSYRLLFGQRTASRRRLKAELDELDKSTEESTPYDPFIQQCIGKVPSTWRVWAGIAKPDTPFSAAILPARCRRDDGFIKEWSTYFAWIHFSSFRWRLLAIQAFGNDHPPAEFLEFLMDPRDPIRRDTARVSVLAVVLAVSFGTLQTSIAARQLMEVQS